MTHETPSERLAADPDAADVALAQQGDVRAFERLYHRHFPRLNVLARWMLGSPDTDDVLQEILSRVWFRLQSFRGEAAFKTWVHQVALNIILRHRENARRHEARQVSDPEAMRQAPAPVDGRDLGTEIESALQRLPERVRDVLILHDMEGYKHHEIAEILGIPAGTSRWHLHTARALFREQFA